MYSKLSANSAMKKIRSFLLSLSMLFLIGCGGSSWERYDGVTLSVELPSKPERANNSNRGGTLSSMSVKDGSKEFHVKEATQIEDSALMREGMLKQLRQEQGSKLKESTMNIDGVKATVLEYPNKGGTAKHVFVSHKGHDIDLITNASGEASDRFFQSIKWKE